MASDRGSMVPVDDVVRRVEERVDPAPPWCARQLELERLPIRVEDDVKRHTIDRQLRREGKAVRGGAPVRSIERDAVPGDIGLPDQLAQDQPLSLALGLERESGRIQ